MITTIIFDLSEVYLKGIFGSNKYLTKLGITLPSNYYFETDEFTQLLLGRISEDSYWNSLIIKNSWGTNKEALKKAVRKNFVEIHKTREIVERLYKKGYKLALLSNHAKEWIEYCELKYKYHKLFHTILYSYQAESLKPSEEIFRLLLAQINTKPQNCLFIDDNKENITTAKNLQFKTLQFNSAKELEKDLVKLGVTI